MRESPETPCRSACRRARPVWSVRWSSVAASSAKS